MSKVSTDEYDLLFDQLQNFQYKNERYTNRIDRIQARRDAIEDPTSAKGARKLARYDRIIGKLESKIASNVEAIDEITNTLPTDQFLFDFDFGLSSNGRDTLRVEWTVIDSPYDDTYVGGDKISIRTYGAGRKSTGGFSRSTTTFGLGAGPVDSSQRYFVASENIHRQFERDEFSTSLLTGSRPDYTVLDIVEM